jgi:hypothetical protein
MESGNNHNKENNQSIKQIKQQEIKNLSTKNNVLSAVANDQWRKNINPIWCHKNIS